MNNDPIMHRYEELISTPVPNGQEAQRMMAEVWEMSASEYRSRGTYENAAKNIPQLSEGDMHLDLGAGFGELLGELHRRDTKAHLIGIDQNEEIAKIAIERLQQQFADQVTKAGRATISGKSQKGRKPYYIKYDRNFGREAPFTVKYNEADIPEKIPPGITYIIGDFLNHQLLRKILGDKKLRSASIMTPGMIKPFENRPFDIGFMRAVGYVLTEHVECGGTALLSQRIQMPSDMVESNLRAAQDFVFNNILNIILLGNSASRWEPKSFEHLTAKVKGHPFADVMVTMEKKK
jgi:hypothetical protein